MEKEKDLLEIITTHVNSTDLEKWITKKDIAGILNKEFWIDDDSSASNLTVWQFKHIENRLEELEEQNLISIWWNTVFIK